MRKFCGPQQMWLTLWYYWLSLAGFVMPHPQVFGLPYVSDVRDPTNA